MQVRKSLFNNLIKRSFNWNNSYKRFSTTVGDIDMPVIDIDKFMNKSQGWEKECKAAADSLHNTGIMIVRDGVS